MSSIDFLRLIVSNFGVLGETWEKDFDTWKGYMCCTWLLGKVCLSKVLDLGGGHEGFLETRDAPSFFKRVPTTFTDATI